MKDVCAKLIRVVDTRLENLISFHFISSVGQADGDKTGTGIFHPSKSSPLRVAHPVLKGPSVVKELIIGSVLGLAAGGLWKMHHWNEQRKTRAFYDLLEKGEISVVVQE
ncbi:hypothetical protein CTI12_AA091610 [Artemisia annua]|uniref:Cytochrome c oxidase subunit 5C n=1 Tax=Artemisia annua TaxID=35608 RepID=A0A2U1PZV1_ARTAN|nr:hypothetical protein CTI12_AA091610 [Artemisia annua]